MEGVCSAGDGVAGVWVPLACDVGVTGIGEEVPLLCGVMDGAIVVVVAVGAVGEEVPLLCGTIDGVIVAGATVALGVAAVGVAVELLSSLVCNIHPPTSH